MKNTKGCWLTIMTLDLNINLVMIRDKEKGIKFFLWNTMKSLELVVNSIFMESDIIGTIHQWIYLLSEYSNTMYFFYRKQISD